MNDKKYSIREIQKISGLSPVVLQEIIRKHRHYLVLEKQKDESGHEETVIGQESFEKLMFIKSLVFGKGMTSMEACNYLKTFKQSLGEDAKDLLEPVNLCLEKIVADISLLKERMDCLLTKYSSVVKQLHDSKTENYHLKKEMEQIREQTSSLTVQLRKQIQAGSDEPPETIN